MTILNNVNYKQREDGKVEVWTLENVRTKGVTAGRVDPPRLLEVISAEEAAERFATAAKEQTEAKARTEQAQAQQQTWEEYCDNLPTEIGRFKRAGCNLEDEWGNYMGFVPREAAAESWSLEKLVDHLDSEEECYD